MLYYYFQDGRLALQLDIPQGTAHSNGQEQSHVRQQQKTAEEPQSFPQGPTSYSSQEPRSEIE